MEYHLFAPPGLRHGKSIPIYPLTGVGIDFLKIPIKTKTKG